MAYKRELIITNQPIQLLDKSKYSETVDSNGRISVSHTFKRGEKEVTWLVQSNIPVIKNHKYYAASNYFSVSSEGDFAAYITFNNGEFNTSSIVDNISSCLNSGLVSFYLKCSRSGTMGGVEIEATAGPQLFDLTATFGAGNEPSTVAEFKTKFPNEFYDYRTSNYLSSYKKHLKVSDVCQLHSPKNFRSGTSANVSFESTDGKTWVVNGTSDYTGIGRVFFQVSDDKIELIKNHYYLLRGAMKNWYDGTAVNIDNNSAGTIDGLIFEQATTVYEYLYIAVTKNPYTDAVFKPQLYDLTEMYGAGNEPKTVDEFKAKFPNELYDYSPRCWVKSYKTGLIAKTKNLFNYSGKLRQYYDIANGTIIETLPNGAILQGNIGNPPGNASYDNGWFRPGDAGGYGTAVTLSANDVVTISADYEILERNYASPTTVGVHLYGSDNLSGQRTSIETGVLYRIKGTYTIAKDGQYYPVFTLNSSKVKITNIQLEKGTTATDYVPFGYL